MKKKFNVIQVGLGPMGKIITNLLCKRGNINLKGAVDINPQLIGKKLSEILEVKLESDLIIESNLDAVLLNEKVDVVIIATSSSLDKVAPLIKKAAKSGANIISICEELSYPFQAHIKLSEELDALALTKDITIVGTGINPGYLMDLLPIVVTAPCQIIKSISVTRMMNSAKRRVPFQRKIGTGLTVEEFHRKIRDKEITGHVGLTQSIQMIVAATGIEYDDILELPPKEILVEEDLKTSYGELVPKGYVCGLQSKAFAKKGDKDVITLNFVAYAGDQEEYDSIMVEGIPRIEQKIIGGVHGDLGTSAMVVNLIPNVVVARSGLLTMKDIPVPCYTENIWKKE
jgi:4-hydroxy-tetrahydrodipicolinate reductase